MSDKVDLYISEGQRLTGSPSTLIKLVDGEIDADRLDYCIRDAHAAGLEFGAIDIERIVSNMMLCKDQDNNFLMIPTDNALSAIESFYHQRYLLYKYEIYHHSLQLV